MNFAVPVNHRVKIKESKKIDLASELKKLDDEVTMIAFVVGALGTVLKSLKKRQRELEVRRTIVTIQTTALLRSAKMQRRPMKT